MFDDWDFATRFRDAITAICESVIEKMRPSARYAEIVTIDRPNRKCTVKYPGETNAVSIPMGSIQPARPGQIVRIAGVLGDRYIDDVMGDAIIAGGVPIGALMDWPAGIATPASYVAANGAYYDPSAYPSLFALYGFTIGQQGQQFRVPTSAGQIIRAS
jgi:hypothetical protein